MRPGNTPLDALGPRRRLSCLASVRPPYAPPPPPPSHPLDSLGRPPDPRAFAAILQPPILHPPSLPFPPPQPIPHPLPPYPAPLQGRHRVQKSFMLHEPPRTP